MKFSKEEVAKRIEEIPKMIEGLKNELHQLLGYQSALIEMEESEKPKEAKKNDAKATN
tara:strand:+ start:453 stop:626 length:174 start_codon:yes stop_codon:yes gene_type:complete